MQPFFIILLLVASVLTGLFLNQDPGYVLISMEHWSMETTVWVGLLLLVIAFALFYLLCTLISKLFSLPHQLSAWYQKHKQHQAQAKARQGLIEFSEGYWSPAEKQLNKSLVYAPLPLFNYLTAAHAAQEQGALARRDHYLNEAQRADPKARLAIKLTQVQLQMDAQQWEQALATLQHLYELAPKHPRVLLLLAKLYEVIKDWSALLSLLPALKKYAPLSKMQIEAIQQRVSLASFLERCNRIDSEPALELAFSTLPKPYQQDPAFLAPYCRYLCQKKDWKQANKLIKKALTQQIHDELVLQYAELPTEENKLDFIKTLLNKNPHSASLHFCLGRIYLETRLFGQARLHLEQSLAIQPLPQTYFYLGQTLETLGLTQEACALFKQGCSLGRLS